ncbi:NAD(P)-dependent alcohol dehydrogenase [Klebsiella electrica]|uniref:NAD(P)-dependent alcohol dehydrogenase n=1 Tax=Klebsiella electrica TaxID=1259973 RepID=A0AAJ5UE38_9ENTR|nr:NAD(P)-dependent alcohol dehydrogenase [Klebsiella electrica]WBW61024.1 NAD(P)-dependent alcohol dehydrogenase [Klebsiella electrica]
MPDILAAVARMPGGELSLETLSIDEPRAYEILVRVVATGVCHTDLVARDRQLPVPFPVVLGHEGAGIVEKTGSAVSKVAPGDPVVMTFASCGHCPSCLDHAAAYCHQFFPRNFFAVHPDGSTTLSAAGEKIHGNFFGQSSFATFAICDERNIVKVPADVPLELLGPLACGIQTGAGSILNVLRPQAGERIAVFGVGSVGLSAIMACRLVGAGTIIAVDRHDSRLALARELGATHTINGGDKDADEEIRAITGYGVDYALDTTGNALVVRQAVESLAPRGVCGIVGASNQEVTLDLTRLMSAGRSVRGIVEGESTPDVLIPRLIDLYRQGRFPFDKLVTFYPFEQINQAIHDSERGVTVKAIVRMPSCFTQAVPTHRC